MKTSSIVWTIFVLVIIIVGIWIYVRNRSYTSNLNNLSTSTVVTQNGSTAGTTSVTSTNENANQNTQTNQLFSGSQYAQYAYLISGTGAYDAKTKKALTGFTVSKKTLSDGSTEITLTATNPEYKTQTYDVKSGQKLYFIEQNLSDDVGTTDKLPVDDHAILVDQNGYIIMQ